MSAAKCPFVVAIVNYSISLKATVDVGSSQCHSMLLTPTEEMLHEVNVAPGTLTLLVYTPSLTPQRKVTWIAHLVVNGQHEYGGGVVESKALARFSQHSIDSPIVTLQLVVQVVQQPTRCPISESLSNAVIRIMQNTDFSPRGGSMELRKIALEVQKQHPREWHTVVEKQHFGSFRSFLASWEAKFVLFKQSAEATSERVVVKLEYRETMAPLLQLDNEASGRDLVLTLLTVELQARTRSASSLLLQLSGQSRFRVLLSAAFSTLMKLLQENRETFHWTSEPEKMCVIGANSRPSALSVSEEDVGGTC